MTENAAVEPPLVSDRRGINPSGDAFGYRFAQLGRPISLQIRPVARCEG